MQLLHGYEISYEITMCPCETICATFSIATYPLLAFLCLVNACPSITFGCVRRLDSLMTTMNL